MLQGGDFTAGDVCIRLSFPSSYVRLAGRQSRIAS